ncbi:MAG: RHS repeat-associated core domain-containing protein [Armatimonadetes bacterium]|nr:RHS repeat-associated core domain-containing protein [Armatimonadota bacterium]
MKKFIWDNQDVLLETDDGGTTQVAYTVSPAFYGEVLAQRKDNASHFYHFDGIGSTTELTDANEAETDSFRYKAFGEALSTSGTTHPPFQYVGKLGYFRHPDTEINMDYVRARWYRPRIGRFMSPDPLLTLGSPYPYATNNPAALVDVTGMQPLGIGGVIAFPECLNNPNLASSIGSSECADQLAIVRHYENEVLSWAEALPGEQDAAAVTGHCTGLTMTMRAACAINCLPPGPMAGYGPYETFVKYCIGCNCTSVDIQLDDPKGVVDVKPCDLIYRSGPWVSDGYYFYANWPHDGISYNTVGQATVTISEAGHQYCDPQQWLLAWDNDDKTGGTWKFYDWRRDGNAAWGGPYCTRGKCVWQMSDGPGNLRSRILFDGSKKPQGGTWTQFRVGVWNKSRGEWCEATAEWWIYFVACSPRNYYCKAGRGANPYPQMSALAPRGCHMLPFPLEGMIECY